MKTHSHIISNPNGSFHLIKENEDKACPAPKGNSKLIHFTKWFSCNGLIWMIWINGFSLQNGSISMIWISWSNLQNGLILLLWMSWFTLQNDSIWMICSQIGLIWFLTEWSDLVAVLLKGRLSVNNNIQFDLFLTQNFQMALEGLKCSTRVIWTTLIITTTNDFMMLSCTFWSLKARKSDRTSSHIGLFFLSPLFSLTYIRQSQIHMPKLHK